MSYPRDPTWQAPFVVRNYFGSCICCDRMGVETLLHVPDSDFSMKGDPKREKVTIPQARENRARLRQRRQERKHRRVILE